MTGVLVKLNHPVDLVDLVLGRMVFTNEGFHTWGYPFIAGDDLGLPPIPGKAPNLGKISLDGFFANVQSLQYLFNDHRVWMNLMIL